MKNRKNHKTEILNIKVRICIKAATFLFDKFLTILAEWFDNMTKINKGRIATYKQICKKYKDEIRYEELIPRRYEIFQSYNIRLRNLG